MAAFSVTYWTIWILWVLNFDQKSLWVNLAWAAAMIIGGIVMYLIVGIASFLVSDNWAYRVTNGSDRDPKVVDRVVDFWERVRKRFGIFTWPWGVAWILGLIWTRSFSWSTVRA
ncbi:MAG TPA: hypothetical protein VEA92_01105 [Candidatus Paceibacterota bacterium]|nr:hypothetical protein [Candidatus Paceibacterota bacterium]